MTEVDKENVWKVEACETYWLESGLVILLVDVVDDDDDDDDDDDADTNARQWRYPHLLCSKKNISAGVHCLVGVAVLLSMTCCTLPLSEQPWQTIQPFSKFQCRCLS